MSIIYPISNIQAVADIIRTTLGPKSMLKMLLDPSGSKFKHSQVCDSPFLFVHSIAFTILYRLHTLAQIQGS